MKKRKNLILAYTVLFLFKLAFWMPIWLLYYREFTDYRGVGIIQSVMMLVGFMTEIPSGALADLIGKKKTIILACLFSFIGEFLMAGVTGFSSLLVAIIVVAMSYSLFSGTLEAFVYDTLVEARSESEYSKVVSIINAITMLSPALASILGGYMYNISIRYPFYGVAVARFIAFLVAFLMNEPAVDTEKFCWKAFLNQNKRGFQSLFSKSNYRKYINALIIGSFIVISVEVLGDAFIIDLGYQSEGMGFLVSVLFLTATLGSIIYSRLVKKFKPAKINIATGVTYMILIIPTLFLNMYIGTIVLLLLALLEPLHYNAISEMMNNDVESRDRATTLSTFSMLKQFSFIIFSYLIGVGLEVYSTNTLWVGISLLFGLLLLFFSILNRKKLLWYNEGITNK
jgi:MFS family permease